MLYAYPLLKTVGQDYEQHIRNKALLSYDGKWNTVRLAEYLAEEILRKERLEWLKGVIDKVLDKLSETERALVALRYFGKRRKKRPCADGGTAQGQTNCIPAWSDRTYFRMQRKLSQKVGAMLTAAGLTERVFERELAPIEMIAKIHRFVQEGRDQRSCS